MAAETVRVFTVDALGDALEGVLVRIFDEAGVFVTQQYSSVVGSDAIADLTLDGDDPPNSYTIRLSKTGVAFDGSLGDDNESPQTIAIYSPAASAPSGTNDFQVVGETFVLPTAIDPLLCRCSGYVRDHVNQVVPNFSLTIRPWNPDLSAPAAVRVVSGSLIATTPQRVITDDSGYVSFDLFRNQKYLAVLEDQPDEPRLLYVPDASSILLPDLLFPVVRSVTFGTNPVSVSIGASQEVVVTLAASDGRDITVAEGVVSFTSSDEAVARATIEGNTFSVVGVGAGSATITVSHSDGSVSRIPDEPQIYTPLIVNVS